MVKSVTPRKMLMLSVTFALEAEKKELTTAPEFAAAAFEQLYMNKPAI